MKPSRPITRIDGLIDDVACRFPLRIAVDLSSAEVSYGALWNEASNWERIVRSSSRTGRIGIFSTRSITSIAAYVGIARAGATAVPLGGTQPVERILRICTAADIDTVVSDQLAPTGTFSSLARTGIKLVKLEDSASEIPAGPHTAFAESDVAYILFTSGSTGTPKGVPIKHTNVVRYLEYVRTRYRIAPGSRLSNTFDLTFDLSVFDLFATLSAGATMVIPDRRELLTPVRYVNDRKISHWFSVPSAISLANRTGTLQNDAMPDLQWSLFCGEQLTLEQARRWYSAAPNSTVENLYGPTELTLSCADFRLPHDVADWPVTPNGTVPIGKIYPHLSYRIDLESVPDSRVSAGELLVNGPQRFAGYLDPADNVGRFSRFLQEGENPSSPFIPDSDDWYRTGDLVQKIGGDLVHLGRLDDQVKVRGFRVEPGEIETTLSRHPGIEEAVIVAIGKEEKASLVLFYTGEHLTTAELREFAAAALPNYMIPMRFEYLDKMPLNANGKVDRKILKSGSTATAAT